MTQSSPARQGGGKAASARQDVVWLAGVSWDGIAGTDRHMVRAMTEHARVLWVDPPVSPLTTSDRQYGAVRSTRPKLTEVAAEITRLTPVALPGLSRPGVRLTVPPMVHAQVRWAVRRLHLQPAAVVMSYLGDLLGSWGPGVVNVLYGTDDYVAGAGLMGVSVGSLLARERRALAKADVVFTVTPQLAQRWASLGASPTVLPNGCWPDTDAGPITAAVEGLARPVIGLVGQLSDRIDIRVLEAVADAGLSLLIVGPHDPRWEPERFARLVSRPQVHYAGAVPVTDVRSYLAAVDVGITPYRDTEFNRASFPLKTLEYFGAGLPVVSADLPAAQWLLSELQRDAPMQDADQVLRLASSPEGFVEAITQMTLAGSGEAGSAPWPGWSDQLTERCVALAEQHSWPRRAQRLAAEIGLAASQPDLAMTRDTSRQERKG